MKRFTCLLLFLSWLHPLQAQENGIDQSSDLLIVPEGDKFLRWYGYAGRSYFVQVSDPNDHLRKWIWAPVIESGNDEEISYEVDGTADKGFFRLKYTDQVPGSNETLETADFDGDGLTNWEEISTYQTDPLNLDTDGDGLPDYWEIANSLDPNDATGINGTDGDPDGDGLSNYDELWNYVDPNNSDTDGDGLSDGDEVHLYGSCPWWDDSDWDGIGDYDEVMLYGTDPNNGDTDGDTLSDWDEIFVHFTNPLKMDSDGDWMWDDYEIANNLDPNDPADGLLDGDGDTLANQLEFVFMNEGYDPFTYNNPAVFPWAGDPDRDGLTTQVEFVVYLTNPKQPDTDGDGFNDGWELAHGFNPKLDNLVTGPANHHPDADPDGDGLTNAEEEQLGTNPNSIDTDGDGVNDNVENDQGSNPNDPNDSAPPPNGTVAVNVTFGDDSGSHSEKYRVQLTPLEGDTYGLRYRTNRHYGQSQTDTLRVPKGAKYQVELIHIGTDPRHRYQPSPDYDHTLEIDTSQGGMVIDDPSGIMGTSDELLGETFVIAGLSATLYVPLFKIKEVSYSGSTIGDLMSDDTIITYDAPQWQDSNDDGDAADSGDRRYPVAYVRNTPPTIQGKIDVKPSGLTSVSGFSVMIRVTGPGAVGIIQTSANIGTNELTLPATESIGNFQNEIDYLSPMLLTWEVQVDDSGYWCESGVSDNRAYITLGVPVTTLRQETLFDIGCRNGDGETVEAVAVHNIWLDFQPDSDGIPRLDLVLPLGAIGPPQAMTYYANSAAPYTTCNGIGDLLATGDGRCGSYQELMIHVLADQGIVATPKNVFAPTGAAGGRAEAIADFIATYGSDPTLIYSIRDIFFVKNWTLSTTSRWNVTDDAGAPAQGSDDPIAVFADHALVEYGSQLYDPSYGTGPFATVLEWEDASLDGFGVQFIDTTNLASGFVFWTRTLDTKGTQEVIAP